MNPWPKLQRTPIIEALIDLRVEPRQDLVVDELIALHDLLGKDAFPHVNKQMTSMIQLAELPIDVVRSTQPSGLLFRGADQTQVVQAQQDGFAYSRLAPYVSWEDLLDNAKTRWAQYVQVARPLHIKRLAVRYINRIQLPHPVEDFAEWIPTFPNAPESLPQGVAEVFQRMAIPILGSEQDMAIITLGLQPYRVDAKVVEVIFDIDIFRVATWPVDGDGIWRALDSLRALKNQFFFGYLSAKTLELFK